MNFKNKLLISLFSLLLTIFPANVLAYSTSLIPGGQNIGIQVNSKGIIVVGFYQVNNQYIGKDAGFEVGDKIMAINDQTIENIEEMVNRFRSDPEELTFTILRGKTEKHLKLQLVKDKENIYKTGLYVKDQINGVGTLTYIDPETRIYGALGHEIIEKSTMEKLEVKDGKIFRSDVVAIEKSSNGNPGEKTAKFYPEESFGTVKENTKAGIFGIYEAALPNTERVEILPKEQVKIGPAKIRTVIEGNVVKEYDINILNLDVNNDIKNILFEITDATLLEKTGGVIQGMSGSPILQDNKLIGAVTHVIVNDSTKGYGIFITNMLEEGEN